MNYLSKEMNTQKQIKGFTLIEITIAVSVFGLLSGIAIPNFSKARKASQRNVCLNNLRQIESAKEMWAFDYMAPPNAVPTEADLAPYLKDSSFSCPLAANANRSSVSSSSKSKVEREKEKEQLAREKKKEQQAREKKKEQQAREKKKEQQAREKKKEQQAREKKKEQQAREKKKEQQAREKKKEQQAREKRKEQQAREKKKREDEKARKKREREKGKDQDKDSDGGETGNNLLPSSYKINAMNVRPECTLHPEHVL